MQPVSRYGPERWAEARRLRAGGASYVDIAARLGMNVNTIGSRARQEAWPSAARARLAAGNGRGGALSPGTAGIRSRLAQRLYRVIECRIKLMELRMIKQLQAQERDADGGIPPAPTKDERESFAALIESINQVTEMASASAPDGRRRAGAGAVAAELAALSPDVDPDGLAVASEKDGLRREIAERLEKIFPPA